MGPTQTLEEILLSLAECQAGVVLVGGWALNLHGLPRQTLDLDLMVAADDLPVVTRALERCGYHEVFRSGLFARFQRKAADSPDVDVLFVTRETFKTVSDTGQHAAVGKADAVVPSLDYMMAMKLHALKYNYAERATKDLPDVANLLRLRGWHCDSPAFADLLRRYGSPEVLERLRVLSLKIPS